MTMPTQVLLSKIPSSQTRRVCRDTTHNGHRQLQKPTILASR